MKQQERHYGLTDAFYDNSMKHHGIRGQKWGVRRFQNQDGSLTDQGRIRYRSVRRLKNERKTRNDVNEIARSMSMKERYLLGLKEGEEYSTEEFGEWVIHRTLEKHGDTPIAFLDLINDGDDVAIAFGVRGESDYRGKGYANKVVQKGLNWYDKNKERLGKERLVWYVDPDNSASIHMAEKNGFRLKKKENSKMLEYYKR